ncbi:hypothetical protein BHE74_00020889 [Ensete ventricosum]|nr:hypothetical protein BHE74_00020889 [Ensete ventricosum]
MRWESHLLRQSASPLGQEASWPVANKASSLAGDVELPFQTQSMLVGRPTPKINSLRPPTDLASRNRGPEEVSQSSSRRNIPHYLCTPSSLIVPSSTWGAICELGGLSTRCD